MKARVAVIMGSDSDLPIMQGGIDQLEDLNIRHEVHIVSAHRTPRYMFQFASQAEKQGFHVIIAGAGGAAHLPGMVASATHLPVIGVPIQVGKLKGMDALLSIAQMPKGVPVATMAVDNSTNAALLAARILALRDKKIHSALQKFKRKQQKKVQNANQRLKEKRS